jgi:UPF0042 nucleotide-binding protein
MQLVVISGRSGSGKSTALHQLEDMGYYCVDNLPAALLRQLTQEFLADHYQSFSGVAVCIDARNSMRDLEQISQQLSSLPEGVDRQVIFLDAHDPVLVKRFSETRRRHPLSRDDRSLAEAIQVEAKLLEPLLADADLVIDTSDLTLYELRAMIASRLGEKPGEGLSVLIESFGFKRGVPSDADLVFDARLLPNPHWVRDLRALTGRDPEVVEFLESQPEAPAFAADLIAFLERWLPDYEKSQRSYVTVAIGCTGGQHRSVYIAEQVFAAISASYPSVQLRHRELPTLEAG